MNSTSPNAKKCAVLVPIGNSVCWSCEESLRELERRGYVVRRVPGFSAIDQARNRIGSSALAEGFEETFWIDSDIGFDPNDVDRLRQSGCPIVCGIYVKKSNRAVACSFLPETKEVVFGERGGMLEIHYAATGFLHVHKKVYEQIERQLSLPTCDAGTGIPFVPYFQPMTLRDGNRTRYLGEDYAFCERVRQCGIPIMADTRIRLRHFGEYGFSWEDAGSAVTRYKTYNFTVEPG